MNRPDPRRCSTRGPKKYRASMLKKMCPMPRGSCANMYVIIVHGRANAYTGMNSRKKVVPCTLICRNQMMTLAMISRWTHGVTGVPPLRIASGDRGPLEGLERGRLLLPGGECLVEPRAQRVQAGTQRVCLCYPAGPRIELRIVEGRGDGRDLAIDLRHESLGVSRTIARLPERAALRIAAP